MTRFADGVSRGRRPPHLSAHGGEEADEGEAEKDEVEAEEDPGRGGVAMYLPEEEEEEEEDKEEEEDREEEEEDGA